MYVLSAADDSLVQLFASPALLNSADTHTHGQNELQGKQARCCSVEKASSSCDQQRRRLVIQPRWIAVMIAFIIPGSRAWGNGQERWELYPDSRGYQKHHYSCPDISAQRVPEDVEGYHPQLPMRGTWAQITAEHVQFRLICVIDRCSWQIMLTLT
jgi:hypothetical protein